MEVLNFEKIGYLEGLTPADKILLNDLMLKTQSVLLKKNWDYITTLLGLPLTRRVFDKLKPHEIPFFDVSELIYEIEENKNILEKLNNSEIKIFIDAEAQYGAIISDAIVNQIRKKYKDQL